MFDLKNRLKSDRLLLLDSSGKRNKEVDLDLNDEEDDDDEEEVFSRTASGLVNKNKREKFDFHDLSLNTLTTSSSTNAARKSSFHENDLPAAALPLLKDSFEKLLNLNDSFCIIRSFQYLILCLTFFLNGAAFCLLTYSREHFVNLLNVNYLTATNCLIVYLLAAFIGIMIASRIIFIYERFYLLFIFSIMSSACLIAIPSTKSITFLISLMFIFGFSFGFTKALAYKWTLRRAKKMGSRNVKVYGNMKLNCLNLHSLLGLCVCLFLIFSYLGINVKEINQTTATTITSSTKQPTLLIQSFENLNSSQRIELVRPRRQVNLKINANMSTTTTTQETTTTTKVHLKKPDAADGSFLEQSHITKPNAATSLTSKTLTKDPNNVYSLQSNSSEELKKCLLSLNRTCTFTLANCVRKSVFVDFIDFNKTESTIDSDFFSYALLTDESFPKNHPDSFNCKYNYKYSFLNGNKSEEISLSSEAQDDSLIAKNFCSTLSSSESFRQRNRSVRVVRLPRLELNAIENLNNTVHQRLVEGFNMSYIKKACFDWSSMEETSLFDAYETFKKFNRTCFLGLNSSFSFISDYEMNLQMFVCDLSVDNCQYDDKLKEVAQDCFRKETNQQKSQITTTTTPISTTPIPTTTTITTTIDTTSTSTIISTTTSIITSTTTIKSPSTTSTTLAPTTSTIRNNDYIEYANDLVNATREKLKKFYANANTFEMFYYILGVFYFTIALLHSLLFVSLLKSFLARFILCIKNKKIKKKKKNYEENNDHDGLLQSSSSSSYNNKRRTLSLNSPTVKESSHLRDFLRKNFESGPLGFYAALVLFFLYGGFLTNFFFYMGNYLISRLSNNQLIQAEVVLKLFPVLFLFGRLIFTGFVSCFAKQHIEFKTRMVLNNATVFSKRPLFFIRSFCTSLLSLTVLTLTLLSLAQLASSHFNDNKKLILATKSFSSSTVEIARNSTLKWQDIASFFLNGTSKGNVVKINTLTMFTFSMIYPFLLSSLLPLLFDLIEQEVQEYETLFDWRFLLIDYSYASMILGACFSTFINNYASYAFSTENIFIYTNVSISIMMLVILVSIAYWRRCLADKSSVTGMSGNYLSMTTTNFYSLGNLSPRTSDLRNDQLFNEDSDENDDDDENTEKQAIIVEK